MSFPVYRKYTNLHSFFVITSPTTWTEYKRFGKSYRKFDFVAQQFPEKLFIQDLISLEGEGITTALKEEIPAVD